MPKFIPLLCFQRHRKYVFNIWIFGWLMVDGFVPAAGRDLIERHRSKDRAGVLKKYFFRCFFFYFDELCCFERPATDRFFFG